MPLSGADVKTVKKQLVVVNKPNAASDPATAVVVKKTGIGPVSAFDKVKGYYHTVIQLVSFLITTLAVIGGVAHVIPGPVAGYIAVASTGLGTLLTFLKSNEHWVDDL